MSEILAQLSQYPVSTRLSLSGTIIVAAISPTRS
jgi:fumarate hydratase class I